MTRRQILALAAGGVMRAQGSLALQFRALDHIEFTVADVERSTMFYAQLFGGAEVMKNRTTTRRYIKLGTSYLAIDRADGPRIDHACIGIENFDVAAVHEFLTARGLTYRDYPSGRDTGVNDPDGTRLQLSSADGWTSLAAQTALPEPRNASAILQPDELFRVDVNVSDLAASLAHYGKMLGPSVNRGYTVGRGKLDLYTGTPGYRGFTVRVRPFGAADVRKRLEGLGARVENEVQNLLQFRDPDGFRVEVASAQ